MEQEKKKQRVRTALLIVLWLIVLALAGGRSLSYLSELHREEQLALLGRMAPLFEGQEEELVKAILQEDSETDAENGRKLLENSGFYRRGYRELGRTASLKFLFCGWCMLAALGVLLLLSSARKRERRYQEIENLGESLFLWKTQIPRAWEAEAEYFRDCLIRCQEQMEKQQAAQKEDMQRQTRYLENLVHQMKTPLAGISLCHDYLEEMETDPGKQDLLTKSREQINHLETLVRQLLLLARLEDGRRMRMSESISLSVITDREFRRLTYSRSSGVSTPMYRLRMDAVQESA